MPYAPAGPPRRHEFVQPYGYPFEVTLVHRAYPYLRRSDRVRAADGLELRFHPPFLFLTAQAEESLPDLTDWPQSSVPRWPLSLVERAGRTPTAQEADSVAAATTVGCHDDELDAWEGHTGVGLPAETDLLPWFLDPGPGNPTYRSL